MNQESKKTTIASVVIPTAPSQNDDVLFKTVEAVDEEINKGMDESVGAVINVGMEIGRGTGNCGKRDCKC